MFNHYSEKDWRNIASHDWASLGCVAVLQKILDGDDDDDDVMFEFYREEF